MKTIQLAVGTYYPSVVDKDHSTLMRLPIWVAMIRDGKFKEPVEEYRKLFQEGAPKEKTEPLKNSLPGYVCATQCMGGRTKDKITGMSNIVMADFDYHDEAWSKKMVLGLKEAKIPGIVGAHCTVSFGLRLYLHVSGFTVENFSEQIRILLDKLKEVVGYDYDHKAVDVNRLTYTSYDPDAWCIEPEAFTEPYYTATEVPVQNSLTPTGETKAGVAQKTVGVSGTGSGFSGSGFSGSNSGIPGTGSSVSGSGISSSGSGVSNGSSRISNGSSGVPETPVSRENCDRLLKYFFSKHSLAVGNRNNVWIKFGRAVKKYGYTPAQKEQILLRAHQSYGDPEYTVGRIDEAMSWGYHHEDRNDYLQWCHQQRQSPKDVSTFNRELTPAAPQAPVKEEVDEVLVMNEQITQNCPIIHPSTYDALPPFLKDLVENLAPGRPRDNTLLTILTLLSSAMPSMKVQVRDNYYSPNLYLFLIAEAGNGKSVVDRWLPLVRGIQKYYDEVNNAREQEYLVQEADWHKEEAKSHREHRSPDTSLDPGNRPVRMTFLAGAQISRARLIENLRVAPQGFLLTGTELGALNEALQNKVGNFKAELRSIAMNEMVSTEYKSEAGKGAVTFPRLSMMFAATLHQFADFQSGPDDGEMSRYFCLMSESSTEWISWAGFDEAHQREKDHRMLEAGEMVTRMFKYLEKSPTLVQMPEKCRGHFDQYCKRFFAQLEAKKLRKYESLIKRAPQLLMRLCSILVGIRKFQSQSQEETMMILEEEYRCMEPVLDVLMRHTMLANHLIQEKAQETRRAPKVTRPAPVERHTDSKYSQFLQALPQEFTTAEFIACCAAVLHLQRTVANELLHDWVKLGWIIQVKRGHYRKA